jgi:hypothetical protein
MVPWPIALLAAVYAVLATASAASVWRIVTGSSSQSLLWAVGWLSLSAAAMCGLALLKPWARTLAVWGFAALALLTLALAGQLVGSGRPVGALVTALMAGLHILAIRYLRRPTVKALFESSGSSSTTQQTAHSTQE